MTTENLWGELPVPTLERLPRHILAEQAAILSRSTDNILEGQVVNASRQADVIHLRFLVRVPILENYTVELFEVFHSLLSVYPVNVECKTLTLGGQCQDEQEFINKVREILQAPRTREIIAALRLQADAA